MRAVIYIRVSSEEQVKNLSLETQRRECERFCQRNGWVVARVFTEEGESAATTNRPQLQAMLSYCRDNANKVGAVVVYNLSRFARNTSDHLAVRLKLSNYGASLRSVCEPIEETTTGKFFETVMAAVAELDNNMRSDRTVAGMKMAIDKGRWPFTAPLGYRNSRNDKGEATLVHDPERAPLIRHAFERYATGHYTKQQVLNKVTAMGLRTIHGNRLAITTFVRVLANPIYTGKLDVRAWGQKVGGNFPPIVSEGIFNSVQFVAQGRRTNTPATHLRDNAIFPLRGSVRCECCGSLLTGYNAKGRTKHYAYYACYNSKCARKTSVKKETLEADFEAYLERWQPKPRFVRLFRKRVLNKWEQNRDAAMLGAISTQAAVEEVEKKLARLDDLFIDQQAITKDVYTARRAKLEEELVASKVALHDCEAEELDIEAALSFACFLMTNAKALYTQLSIEQKRRLLAVLSPAGFTLDGKGGVRTVTSDCLFNGLYEAATVLVQSGTPGGI
ncbi:MAG TPA: recombinase family protein [Verrucomicrobiae bacterium]|nr:recombinase family protein [Verrucomicrobiae bacterium]